MTRIETQMERKATARPTARRRAIRVVAPTASGRRWQQAGPARRSEVDELAVAVGRARAAGSAAFAA